MNVTFEKKDALNGTVTVEISAQDYMLGIEKKINEYRKKANIPGFRPGQAPKSMIEKMYGSTIVFEEVNQTASKGLFDFIDDQKLNILGQPLLNEDTAIDSLEKGKDYAFKFDIGISPEFDLNISKDDVFVKYEVSIGDKTLEDEMDRMARRFGKHEDVELSEENDFLYLHLQELNDENQSFDGGVNAESVPMAINLIKNEEVRAMVIGKKVGDTCDLNVFALFDNDEQEMSHALNVQKLAIPDLHPNFRCTIKQIKRTAKAEINQELFDQAFGPGNVTSVDEMKEKIRQELAAYYNQQAQHLLEHELTDTLVSKHPISLPDAFLKRWLVTNHSGTYNAENVEHGYEHESQYLRNHLFEEKVLTTNNVQVQDEDIRQAAMENTRAMFMQYGMQGNLGDDLIMNIVNDSLKKEDYRSRMTNVAIRRKMIDVLLGIVTINTQIIAEDEFMQIVTEHNEKHHAHNHNH